MSNACIGLFGTCGKSEWRYKFIEEYNKLGIYYYNPQVDNWVPNNAKEEANHLINDDIILFPVTSETYGVGSLSETGYSILSAISSDKNRFIVVYIADDVDTKLYHQNKSMAEESRRARVLVKAHLEKMQHPNVFIVSSLDEMLQVSIELEGVVKTLNEIRSKLTS